MGILRNVLAFGVLMLSVSSVMTYEDTGDMENALKQLMKQNQQLQKQMSTITAGLTEMCRAVNIATCDCDQARETESHVVDDMQELKLLTLESHGEQNDSVQLTLKFEATDDYSLEWMQLFMHGNGMMRSHGQLEKIKIMNNRYLYTSHLQLHDVRFTRKLIARIYSLRYSASIDVNLDAVLVKGEQMIPKWKHKITQYPRQLTLPNDLEDEYNITVNVDRTILELEKKRHPGHGDLRPDAYFTLINTTSEAHTIAELYLHVDIIMSHNDNGVGDVEVVFTIMKEHLENGGLFSFSLPHVGEGYVEAVKYGVVIEILSEEYMSVVPPGSIAIYHNVDNIYAAASVVSVTCIAMGNPPPDVTISKEVNGQLKALQTDTLIKDKVSQFESITLNDLSKKGRSSFGVYVCRASNGNNTIEHRINVERYQAIAFDERKTGLSVNNTNKIVVTCKASGNPTPELEVRLGSNYGPNLLTAQGNYTSKVKTKRGSSKVVITFSPPDQRLDTVFCYARANGVHFEHNEKEVRIFPEIYAWKYDKWAFYDSFVNQTFTTSFS